MGTPDERGKRTWRFRLNDTSILEVSTPPRATEKQIRRRGRVSLIVGTFAAAVALAAVALASDVDTAVVDTDAPTGSVSLAAGGEAPIAIKLTVSGRQVNPATLKIYKTWTLSGGAFAGTDEETVNVATRATGVPADTYTVNGTVKVDAGQAAGGPFTLAIKPHEVATTAPAALAIRDASNYQVTVTAPPPPSDTSAPDISYVLSPASPDGLDGWYKTNVTLTWTVTENESPSSLVETGCVDQNITADQQEQTYSCSATSDGGSAGPVDVKIKRDATAPSITRDASADTCSLPGDNGWCRGSQTAGFTASDATSGIAPVGTSPIAFTQSTTTNGSAISIPSGTRFDRAGNESNSISAGPFKIDSLKPLNTVTGVANGQTYTLGSVPAAGCSTQDQGSDNSGVAVIATLSVTGGTVNGVGAFVAKCSGGKDNAGNTADDASVMYSVFFGGLSGILQPINPDNSSVFSRGKAVPVKFRLAGDEYTGFNVSGWTLKQQQTSCTVDGDPVGGEVEPVVENPSNGFRYDASADQYIYNANFKDKTVGTCWKVVVTLDSGQKLESAVFKLQK